MEHTLDIARQLLPAAGASLPMLVGVRLLLLGECERDNFRHSLLRRWEVSRRQFEKVVQVAGVGFVFLGLGVILLMVGR